MPTYEYECHKCGKNFELFQSMNDSPLRVCPKKACRMRTWGKGKVRRLLSSGAGLIFKGSGFYITDYRSENYKQAAKKENEAASPAKKDSDVKGSVKKESSSSDVSSKTKTPKA